MIELLNRQQVGRRPVSARTGAAIVAYRSQPVARGSGSMLRRVSKPERRDSVPSWRHIAQKGVRPSRPAWDRPKRRDGFHLFARIQGILTRFGTPLGRFKAQPLGRREAQPLEFHQAVPENAVSSAEAMAGTRPMLWPFWILAAVAILLLASLAPVLIRAVRPVPKPVFPEATEMEQILYRSLVPEEQPSDRSKLNPVVLKTLQLTTYTIKAGETISQIAQEFKLNLDTILSWNDIRDARTLKVGMALEIPNTNGLKYTVRRGDTLERIARSAGVPLNGILDWNSLTSQLITPGQDLFLPGARMSSNQVNGILGKLFIYPVAGELSSRFGNRPDPFTGEIRFHEGIDLAANTGTPIYAAMGGTVRSTGVNPIFGKFVIMQHDGYQTLYGHMSRILVQNGQTIGQGGRIGDVGNTGYSTGSHLHFGIYKGGVPVDPLRFLH